MSKIRTTSLGLIVFCAAVGLSVAAEDTLVHTPSTFDDDLRMKGPTGNLMLVTNWAPARCGSDVGQTREQISDCRAHAAAVRRALMQR